MSIMSHNHPMLNEISAQLLWLEFPNNSREAIQKIDQLYYSMKAAKRPWTPEIVVEMVNQFIFNIFDSRDLKSSRLTTMNKLSLAEIITTYLSFPGSDVDRQTMFNTIFYSTNFHKGDVPLLILSLVTSLAMAFQNAEVLKCISVWMMNAGLDNPSVLYIASDLTKDLVTDENPEKYDVLPKKAMLFTAAILIAIGKTFRNTAPSARLINQVTKWIEVSPSVCFIPPQSAIFEIFRWCINSAEDQSRLHFTLLSAIERGGKGAQLQVIPHIMTLIQELRVKREQGLHHGGNNGSMGFSDNVELSVDRLFQLIQMLITSDCLDRNEIRPIFEAAEEARLPSTTFYEIMKGIY